MLFALLLVCVVLFVVLPFINATLWSVITTLCVGLLLGALARVIVPGSGRMGCLTTALVGVAGSLLGTMAARGLDVGSFAQLLLQVGTAVVLVMILRPTSRPSKGSRK